MVGSAAGAGATASTANLERLEHKPSRGVSMNEEELEERNVRGHE